LGPEYETRPPVTSDDTDFTQEMLIITVIQQNHSRNIEQNATHSNMVTFKIIKYQIMEERFRVAQQHEAFEYFWHNIMGEELPEAE